MKSEPIVYVVQNQHRWDGVSRTFVPKFDLSSAHVYGDMVELLSPTASPFHLDDPDSSVMNELREKLKNYRDEDFLLLIGNPALILAVGSVAASYNNGRVRILQWSGKDQRYISVTMSGLAPGFTS